MSFNAKVSSTIPDVGRAVPGASAAVTDRADSVSLESILDVVRAHLEGSVPGTTVTIEVTKS